jgi:hypothetical protein
MKAVYNALSGPEVVAAIIKSVTKLALTIPGMSSRVVTFPRVLVDINIRVRAFDRAEVTAEAFDELIDKLVAEGIEEVAETLALDERRHVTIDEAQASADQIRRESDLAVTRPSPQTDGRVVDLPVENPALPEKENLSNIRQFGAPGTPAPGTGTVYSGKGRVIEQESVGLNGSPDVIRPKLVGDPGVSHFRIRPPKG